ncbi:MAG: helicase [Melioribacteraceae bacterium]|nr:MAG: helicase [Melioribacteraceae bacterium]
MTKQKDSGIYDNKKNGNVADFLKEHLETNSSASFVTAYFTVFAYQKLKAELDNISSLRLLFGEPTFIKSLDPTKANHRESVILDKKITIGLEAQMAQRQSARECADWIKHRVEIKSMVKPNFLHGKMYHIEKPSTRQKAIFGSSNFTVKGLGLSQSSNIELNMQVQDNRDIEALKTWFDDLWNDESGLVEDVREQVLRYLEKAYLENEPEFIYYKTLYHIFENYLGKQEAETDITARTGFFETEIWNMLYDFQKDGVKGAIKKIQNHNGCILADSVGLGKTFEALAVIKYFELKNEKVLVLCPKKLSDNWTVYQAAKSNRLNPLKKDRFGYSVLYHTDLGRETGNSSADGIDLANFEWGAYDLVVIDESHNFRGNPREKETEQGENRPNRAKWLMDKIIQAGQKTKVLLLSATPVNNTLRDLRNQFYIITAGGDVLNTDSGHISSIASTLKRAQTQFTQWAAEARHSNRNVRDLLEKLDTRFFRLLDELTIARSRKHIKGFYKKDTVGEFPRREKPESVYTNIDTMDRFTNYDSLNKKILKYKLSLFNPSLYLLEDKKGKYEEKAAGKVREFKQKDRETMLIGMMKVNFLKRLESSIESFEISMDRTIKKIDELKKRIQKFQKYQTDKQKQLELNYEHEIAELEEDGEEVDWRVGKKFTYELADLNLDSWLADLEADKEALDELYNLAHAITVERDAKLKRLKELIQHKINNPYNEENKKVIIFTAFADTASYLYDNLKDWCVDKLGLNIALVAGSTSKSTYGRNDFAEILTNFSPVSKNRNKIPSMMDNENIDILIGTDCISEGQNLQDCDYLINYDIHWNPVRIIQRFGRIDRLGSTNKTIRLVNFWPTKDLDNYINLKERVESRMALVDVAATGEDDILNSDQIKDLVDEDMKYRNRQLKKLREEILDIEDMEEGLSLTDFSLDDFRIDLLGYIEQNKQKLHEAPLGLYAVVPAPGGEYSGQLQNVNISQQQKEILKPGVIFCLRHSEGKEENNEINPLHPYYLLFVRNDGTVRYTFANAKQVLDAFRLTCGGRKEPYEDLCELFNSETRDGKELSFHTRLMKKAVTSIKEKFAAKGALNLTSGRDAVLIPHKSAATDKSNYELITWLILK